MEAVLAGSIVLATHNPELIIFKLSNNNSISFRVLDDEDIMLIDARIREFDGRQVLKISQNYDVVMFGNGVC